MVKVMSLLAKAGSGLRFSFGVRAWTGMEIRCVIGMYRLKLVSSRNNSVFNGFMIATTSNELLIISMCFLHDLL